MAYAGVWMVEHIRWRLGDTGRVETVGREA